MEAIKELNNIYISPFNLETAGDNEIQADTLKQAILFYRDNPAEYVKDNLSIPDMTETQKEVFEAFFKYRKIAVSTHNAFGKSFLASVLALTVMNLYADECKGATIAPTFQQVRDVIWSELHSIFENTRSEKHLMPLGKMGTVRYEIGAKTFLVGRSPKINAGGTGQSLNGLHAHVIIIIVDEACGVNRQIFEQIERITNTGGIVFILFIGNPLDINSYFGQIFHTKEGEGYYKLSYTAYENPNLIANGLTSMDAITKEGEKIKALPESVRREYYENKHYKIVNHNLLSPGYVMKAFIRWGASPLFLTNVIGEWVATQTNALVTVIRATELMAGTYINENKEKVYIAENEGYCKYNGDTNIYVGIDAAREGDDKIIIYALQGNKEIFKRKFNKTYIHEDSDYKGERLLEDGNYIAGEFITNLVIPYKQHNIRVEVDCGGGYGDTIYDSIIKHPIIKTLNLFKIRRIKFNENADKNDMYTDKASEIICQLADDINSEYGIIFDDIDEDLKNQLTNRRRGYDNKSRFKIESKKEYKIRSGSTSPDEMDALALANDCRHWNENQKKMIEALTRTAGIKTGANKRKREAY